MDYVIKNSRNLLIRLDDKRKPMTCEKKDRELFEYSKAKNIVENLPKTLRRLNFRVEAVPDMGVMKTDEKETEKKKTERNIIQTENYVLPDSVKYWVEKFTLCDDIFQEARNRKMKLYQELSNIDKQFSNLIHEIEFEGKVDLYGGWKERNKIKVNREKRRCIKDEIFLISNVLKMDIKTPDREAIGKIIKCLTNRKFIYRVVEEEEDEM